MKRFDQPCARLIAPCASILAEATPTKDAPLLSPEWDKASFDAARDYPIDALLFIAFGGGF